tara:strand:+ start:944 stop:1318 length:375 start_codon:yes stop_codon:yes gene_type:complete
MRLNVIYSFLFLLFVNGLFSCSKDKTTEPLPCDANSLFETEVKLIFLNNCTSCHNSNINYAGIILEDYESIVENIDHSMSEINAGTMPYDENFNPAITSNLIDMLNDTIIEKIECWILNGMENN